MTPPRPIRIVRIIARLNVGGPAIHVTLLTERFTPPDYESTLICGQIGAGEGDMRYYAEARGVTPLELPELGREINPLRDWHTLWALVRLLRQLRPDIVHTHTAKAGMVGRVAARLAGVPVVVHTFHGHVFHGYFSPLKTRLFIALEYALALWSDRVITLTDGLRREIAEVYRAAPAHKISVVSLGLDLRPFYEMPRKAGAFRAAHGIPPTAPLIGIVGRIVPVKNHALFIEAAAKVMQQRPNAHFAIIGDGEADLRAALTAQIERLGLRERVTFTGWLRDLAPVYSDLDAVAISSLNEGTPVSLIEALAGGCPVAATAVGGLPDLLEGGVLGELVPSGDADALAAALLRLIDQPPDETTTQARRARMIERYGIDRLAGDLDALYRELLHLRAN